MEPVGLANTRISNGYFSSSTCICWLSPMSWEKICLLLSFIRWADGGEPCNPGAGAEVRFAALAGGGQTAYVGTG